MANQWDLFSHCWVLFKYGNTNIVHMTYLLIMLIAALIGPGSIFLLLVGGLHMALGMGLWASLALNAALAILFFVVSIFRGKKDQLLVAKVLSVLYAIVMLIIMVVLVIEAVRLRDSCAFTPTTTTLIIVASVYVIAGLLHPTLHCTSHTPLPWGVIYYLTIPCMYFFLTFYCLFNLVDTSWGTREDPKKEENDENEEEEGEAGKEDEEAGKEAEIAERGGEECERREEDSWMQKVKIQLEERVGSTMRGDVKIVEQKNEQASRPNDELWKKVCDELKPLSKDKEKEERIKKDLQTLRINAILFVLFCNITFVFTIFLMQVRFNDLNRFAVDWRFCPLNSHLSLMTLQNTTTASPALFFEDQNMRTAAVPTEDVKYLQLDPINLIFIVLFLGVMFFQFLGTVFHRVRNAGHLMATIDWPYVNNQTPTATGTSAETPTSSSNIDREYGANKKHIRISFTGKQDVSNRRTSASSTSSSSSSSSSPA